MSGIDLPFNSPAWQKIGKGPHHGVQVALCSLHSSRSSGIGEFLDLLPLIDWCIRCGFNLIQLLPLNHALSDPSPYETDSSFALNPIHLSLWALPYVQDHPSLIERLRQLRPLNGTARISYPLVAQEKLLFLEEYYTLTEKEIRLEENFHHFVQTQPWVYPYALFKVLQADQHRLHWSQWPSDLQHPSEETLQALYKTHASQIQFYIAVQYLCFCQLSHVKKHASEQHVLLMGDLPILMSAQSVDNWYYWDLFDDQLGAGAPPDPYNLQGQNWRLPLFLWKEEGAVKPMLWWQQRLDYASHFYDLIRLDHVVGFFRLFAIPFKEIPFHGRYIPENLDDAQRQGTLRLTALTQRSSLLLIGEDLGTVPDFVRPTLKKLGICGTKVMRWERRWNTDQSFIPGALYEPLSLSCVSTHDSEPLALWWTQCEAEARAFAQFKGWTYTRFLTGPQREEILQDSHSSASLFHVNPLQEYLAFCEELVHAHPEEERINCPGTVNDTNWTYRYRPSVEEIVAHQTLATFISRVLP